MRLIISLIKKIKLSLQPLILQCYFSAYRSSLYSLVQRFFWLNISLCGFGWLDCWFGHNLIFFFPLGSCGRILNRQRWTRCELFGTWWYILSWSQTVQNQILKFHKELWTSRQLLSIESMANSQAVMTVIRSTRPFYRNNSWRVLLMFTLIFSLPVLPPNAFADNDLSSSTPSLMIITFGVFLSVFVFSSRV